MGTQVRFQRPAKVRKVRLEGVLVPERFELHWTFTDDDAGEPELHAVFEVIDGVPQCREYKVICPPGGRQLMSGDFRDIRIDDLVEFAFGRMGQPIEEEHDGIVVSRMSNRESDLYLSAGVVARARRNARRKGPTDRELEKVAEICRANPGAHTKAVAAHFGIAHRTASLWVRRAREHGIDF